MAGSQVLVGPDHAGAEPGTLAHKSFCAGTTTVQLGSTSSNRDQDQLNEQDYINVDFHLIWEPPVFVRTADGHRQRIDGPDAALQLLNHAWPSAVRPLCDAARRRCVDAISRRGSTDLVRRTFAEAAHAAEVCP